MGKIILDLELRRKVFHLFALFLWFIPIALFPTLLTLLTFLLVLFINLLTVLGFGKERFSVYYSIIYKLEREKNYSRPTIQALWANLGIFLSFLAFGKEPTLVGVVVLAVGDAFAGLVGVRYGKRKIGKKSLEGSLAFFLSTFLVLLPFVGMGKAFWVSFVCALVEVLPFKMDDNFTIPLTAGFLYKVFSI
ncbi:MAG: diacylglycerol/polyprenol kinase family protein [Aquificaceae bacterium]